MTLEESGYLAELRASHDPQDETRVENLAELVAVAQEYDDRRATELPHISVCSASSRASSTSIPR